MPVRVIQRCVVPSIPSIALLALMLVLGGCALSSRQPDLDRLYETGRTDAQRPPVVLIPGLMGMCLISERDGEIWVGSLVDLMLSSYRHAALDIDPDSLEPMVGDVRPGGLTSKFAGRDFYGSIVRTLEQAGGYRRAEPGEPVASGEPVYYVLEPGDGVVTKASLLARESLDPRIPRHRWSHFPPRYPLFPCERHGQLSTNVTFQNNLLNFLLNRDEA